MTRKLRVHELGRLTPEAYREAPKWGVHVVLDQVRSLNNVGSFFRTADGFRVEHLWLCGATAAPPHRDIRKTALGAEESVAWTAAPSALTVVQQLQREGFYVVVLEQTSASIALDAFQPPRGQKLALVFGHEVRGVDQAVVAAADACVEIPQWGSKHSFNVSVAAGMVLWDLAVKTGRQP
jgi:tRNA G18 (ribose-2'-O)-methylase SpoU